MPLTSALCSAPYIRRQAVRGVEQDKASHLQLIAMAVEAHHLLHTGGQKLAATHPGWQGGAGFYDAPAASTAPGLRQGCFYTGSDVAVVGRQSQLMQQGYQHQQQASVPMMMWGQYGGQAESGVTFGGAQAQEVMAPCRKRMRVAEQSQFLGLGAAAHLQQQLVDVDGLAQQHMARTVAELAEQRRRHARQVAATVAAAAAKRLRAKDEEIERMMRLNWALEERVRSLSLEAQVWRDLAQSNEAAANALRGELQVALDAQQAGQGVAAQADDAASCCCGENDDVAGGEEEVGTTAARRCAVCGAAEALILPCGHLCACGCTKDGNVCVNFP